jgi:hypothetical protein
MPRDRRVLRFAIVVLLWLGPCFAAWYWLARLASPAVGWLGLGIAKLYKEGLLIAVEAHDRVLVFDTSIVVAQPDGSHVRILAETDYLLYTYGTALFLALALASRARWWHIVAGLVAMLPFQAWGVAFDAIANVGFRMGWEITQRASLFGWRREFAALAYQLGSLIFPVLVPVLLWGLLERHFIRRLTARAPQPTEKLAAAPAME